MDGKRIVSVICEYNPFHFGHKFQLDELKAAFDCVVCVLSGNIVQRGSPAVADKYIRAEAALLNGADLVLEHPVPYCCASARDFARSGVYIADSVGSDFLAFGAEDETDLLFAINSLVCKSEFESEVSVLAEENKNISYPQAVTEIIKKHLGTTAAVAVKKPNNILSLEYLKAMEGKSIKPFILRRNPEFASSSQIRSTKNGEKMLSLLPEQSHDVFLREQGKAFPRSEEKLDAFFVGSLRGMDGNSLPKGLYSVPEDLAKKILSKAVKFNTVDDIVTAVADKNYTKARVRRGINAMVFGITDERVLEMPPYTAVLAANQKGREILRNAKNNGKIDIVNKPVRALEMGEKTKKAFSFAKRTEDIISLSDPIPAPSDVGKNPIIGE